MHQHPVVLAAILVLTGCTLAPRYTRPPAPVAQEWPAQPAHEAGRGNAIGSSTRLLPWKEYFGDPKLRQLLTIALTNNRDLRLATLNVARARSLYGIQRAELLPTIDAVALATRQRIPRKFGKDGKSQTSSRYDVSLGVAAWEIDFFGRIRSLKDRALETYLASEQGRRGAEVLLISSVADAYLALAADRDSLRLAETTLATQQGAFNLIQHRHQLGLTPELDVYRAQTQVDTARVDVARFTQIVALDENALSLLLGMPIAEEAEPTGLAKVDPPADITAGLPSEVLLQRPDVLAAEHLLKAAYADIGAARATFFPRIALTAALGSASGELSGLFKAGSGAWSYAPQIVMPIFDSRTWSAYKAAKVQQAIALTEYERAIQAAFREVADALAVRDTVDQQVAAQQSLVHAVAETYRLSSSRYERGIDSYLSVLDAQRSLYAAQQTLVSLQLAKLAGQVRLYATLGGGGNEEEAAPSPAPATRADRH